MDSGLNIIHEDAELLVLNKPAGLVCHPTKGDEFSSLISRVRRYLGSESRPHLVNRLDRETSGLILVAKCDDAARELRRLWESRAVEKLYLAIVHGHVPEPHGLIDAPLGRDQRSEIAIKDIVRPDGAPSQTSFWVERRFAREEGDFTLLRVIPHTGRKHQIRLHLAHIGHPIVGDKLYGDDERLYLAFVKCQLTEEQRARLVLPHHALHAATVRFDWRAQRREFRADPEQWFLDFLTANAAESQPGN